MPPSPGAGQTEPRDKRLGILDADGRRAAVVRARRRTPRLRTVERRPTRAAGPARRQVEIDQFGGVDPQLRRRPSPHPTMPSHRRLVPSTTSGNVTHATHGRRDQPVHEQIVQRSEQQQVADHQCRHDRKANRGDSGKRLARVAAAARRPDRRNRARPAFAWCCCASASTRYGRSTACQKRLAARPIGERRLVEVDADEHQLAEARAPPARRAASRCRGQIRSTRPCTSTSRGTGMFCCPPLCPIASPLPAKFSSACVCGKRTSSANLPGTNSASGLPSAEQSRRGAAAADDQPAAQFEPLPQRGEATAVGRQPSAERGVARREHEHVDRRRSRTNRSAACRRRPLGHDAARRSAVSRCLASANASARPSEPCPICSTNSPVAGSGANRRATIAAAFGRDLAAIEHSDRPRRRALLRTAAAEPSKSHV